MRKNKFARLAIFLIPLIFTFSQCFHSQTATTIDPRGNQYAGSATCVSCHKNINGTYMHTAHFLSASVSDANNIQGSFESGKNVYVYNPHLKVMMEKNANGFFQTSYADSKKTQSQKFDVTFGSVKGESYAYWVANELFQLPVSYNNLTHQWINSPGYDTTKVAFDRAINAKCLNCHVGYAKQEDPAIPGFNNTSYGFNPQSMIYNIDCERCHGPAAEHVKFHMENPDEKTAKYIIHIASLTREQKINMCAVCHSGTQNPIRKSTFTFKATDTLENYLRVAKSTQPVDYQSVDVHGNQKALLESSKCFINSGMTCNTCHNTHENQRGNDLLFAGKCSSCHADGSNHQCKLANKLSASVLKNNCISCHMPALTTKAIVIQNFAVKVHTHHIAIYPEESQKILKYSKSL